MYQLMFSSASRSDNVILGQPTTITIIDEDGNKFEMYCNCNVVCY